MKFKGAIFDMDGTIIDSLSFWDVLWRAIGEKYMGDASFRPSDEINKKVRTMIFADAMIYFNEYYKLTESVEDFLKFASSGVRDFYKNTAKVKDGAKELLFHLKENNIPLCLASASDMDLIEYVLTCHGLSKYFDFTVSCADIGVGKERPDVYIEAKELMGLNERDICVFEDSYVAIETAKSAGFQTVGVYDRYSPEQKRLENSSDVYLCEGQNLKSLIDLI